jgi:hypothetical protein
MDDDAAARWNALSLEERQARLAAPQTPEAQARQLQIERDFLAGLSDGELPGDWHWMSPDEQLAWTTARHVPPSPVRASDQPLKTSATDQDGPGWISSQRNYTPGMCEGCTRREFGDRQRERIRQTGQLVAEIHRAWWRSGRKRRLRQEVARIAAEEERDYAEHMTRDGQGRLVFRCPQPSGQPHGAE